MFNFKKFAQNPDYINYLQTNLGFSVTTQQLETLYNNLGKHFSKDYIVQLPEEILKFLCDHTVHISIARSIIQRTNATYDFLERFLYKTLSLSLLFLIFRKVFINKFIKVININLILLLK